MCTKMVQFIQHNVMSDVDQLKIEQAERDKKYQPTMKRLQKYSGWVEPPVCNKYFKSQRKGETNTLKKNGNTESCS